jgi:hypothetical protein
MAIAATHSDPTYSMQRATQDLSTSNIPEELALPQPDLPSVPISDNMEKKQRSGCCRYTYPWISPTIGCILAAISVGVGATIQDPSCMNQGANKITALVFGALAIFSLLPACLRPRCCEKTCDWNYLPEGSKCGLLSNKNCYLSVELPVIIVGSIMVTAGLILGVTRCITSW